MEEMYVTLGLICIIILWVRNSRLKRAFLKMEDRLAKLEKSIGLTVPFAQSPSHEDRFQQTAEDDYDNDDNEVYESESISDEFENEPEMPPLLVPQSAFITAELSQMKLDVQQSENIFVAERPAQFKATERPNKIKIKKELPGWLLKLEKQLIENWTGILGTTILVMGVGFLGIYAAINLSAVFRFMMICAVAVLLFGSFTFLRRFEKWIKLSRWLSSGSGAVLMLAFLGGGGIPGLKFIEDPTAALLLLLTGIVINLYFGFAGGTQYFASIHALISLAGLAVVPQQDIVMLIIAGAVVFFSMLLSFRSRWEYHLLFTLSLFFAYHVFWYLKCGFPGMQVPLESRITGIAVTLAVGILAIISHYREIYKTSKIETLPFITHLLSWAYLATGLMLYSTGSKWNTVVFALGAIVVFALARRGRELGVRWLYITDTLIAQSIALFAAITLSRWGLDKFLIATIAYLEITIYLITMNLEGEWILQKIGIILHHCSLLFLSGLLFATVDFNNSQILNKNIIVTVAIILLETVFHLYLVKRNGEGFDSFGCYISRSPAGTVSISGILISMVATALWLCLFDSYWATWPIGALTAFLLIIRSRSQSNGIGIGLIVLVVFLFSGSWFKLLNPNGMTTIEMIAHALPLFVVAALMLRTAYIRHFNKHFKWGGVYLLSAHLGIVSYALTEQVSPLIPGVLWLSLSILYFETAMFLSRRAAANPAGSTDRYVLHASYVFTILFLARHFMIDFQAESYLLNIPVRAIIQVYAFGVFIYQGLVKQPEGSPSYRSWKYLHPLFWELSLVFYTVLAVMQVPDNYHPLVWTGTALMLLLMGRKYGSVTRMRFYSILYFWAAAFHVAFIMGTSPVLRSGLLSEVWVAGISVMAFQIVYLVALYRHACLDSVEFPASLSFLKAIVPVINNKRTVVIYYLFTAEILYAIYSLFSPISPFIPGLLWLVISLVFLELAQRMQRKYGDALLKGDRLDEYLLNSGYAAIAVFIIGHFMVNLQSEMYFGPIRILVLIEIFALSVFVYWAMAKSPATDHPYRAWQFFHPLMWELSIIFLMTTLVLETPEKIHPVLWTVGALILTLLGHIFRGAVSRLRFYSLIFHWIAVFTIAFFLTSYIVPSDAWSDQVWPYSSVAILIQFIYIVMFYKFGALGSVELPPPVKFLKKIIGFVDRHSNLAVYYPFFISIAFFVYKTFSSTLHTLLWVLESFGIFIVSVILKENHFRYLSMGVLSACLARLLLYDFARSGTAAKGIVFVCIGALMLGMNVIYNKYKDRF